MYLWNSETVSGPCKKNNNNTKPSGKEKETLIRTQDNDSLKGRRIFSLPWTLQEGKDMSILEVNDSILMRNQNKSASI